VELCFGMFWQQQELLKAREATALRTGGGPIKEPRSVASLPKPQASLV
jgi:hypothetical protein